MTVASLCIDYTLAMHKGLVDSMTQASDPFLINFLQLTSEGLDYVGEEVQF